MNGNLDKENFAKYLTEKEDTYAKIKKLDIPLIVSGLPSFKISYSINVTKAPAELTWFNRMMPYGKQPVEPHHVHTWQFVLTLLIIAAGTFTLVTLTSKSFSKSEVRTNQRANYSRVKQDTSQTDDNEEVEMMYN